MKETNKRIKEKEKEKEKGKGKREKGQKRKGGDGRRYNEFTPCGKENANLV